MRVIARIVCWNCRKGDLQLFNVRNKEGRKTEDYVCVNCKPLVGPPPIGNMSKYYFPTEEQLKAQQERIQQVLTEQSAAAQPSEGPKITAIEGDPVVA